MAVGMRASAGWQSDRIVLERLGKGCWLGREGDLVCRTHKWGSRVGLGGQDIWKI